MTERLSLSNVDLIKTVEVLRTSGVSFDIDGVEAETAMLSTREYNLLYGLVAKNPKTVDDITEYAIMADWVKIATRAENPWPQAVAIWNSKKVLEDAGAVEGTSAIVKFLQARGIQPFRITSRPGYTRPWTLNWYSKMYGPSFDMSLIRMQEESEKEISPTFKANEIKRLGIKWHFEDSTENAEIIVELSDANVILVPQPWNQAYKPENDRIVKVTGYFGRLKMMRAFLTLAERITNS